jgi:hypothetical protein
MTDGCIIAAQRHTGVEVLSVRIKPDVEARLIERARRDNVTKSRLVNELLARALAPAPDPYELLLRFRRGALGEDAGASASVGAQVKAKLSRKSRSAQPRSGVRDQRAVGAKRPR